MSVPQEIRLDQKEFATTIQLVKDVVVRIWVLRNSRTSRIFLVRILKVTLRRTTWTMHTSQTHITIGILRGYHL